MLPSSRVSTATYPYELHPSALTTSPGLTALGVDVQLLAQTVIYYSTILFGLLIAVPVGLTTSNFRGYCALYAEVSEDRIEFGTSANCHFVTYMHVVCSVLYASTLAGLYTYAVIRSSRGSEFEILCNQFANLVILGFNIFITFLSLVSACILSVGFARWCSSLLVNAHIHHSYQLQTCSEAEQLDWQNVNGTTFHSCYSLATAASWLCLFAWLVQTGLNIVVFVQHKHDEFGSTPLGSSDSSPIHGPQSSAESSTERWPGHGGVARRPHVWYTTWNALCHAPVSWSPVLLLLVVAWVRMDSITSSTDYIVPWRAHGYV